MADAIQDLLNRSRDDLQSIDKKLDALEDDRKKCLAQIKAFEMALEAMDREPKRMRQDPRLTHANASRQDIRQDIRHDLPRAAPRRDIRQDIRQDIPAFDRHLADLQRQSADRQSAERQPPDIRYNYPPITEFEGNFTLPNAIQCKEFNKKVVGSLAYTGNVPMPAFIGFSTDFRRRNAPSLFINIEKQPNQMYLRFSLIGQDTKILDNIMRQFSDQANVRFGPKIEQQPQQESSYTASNDNSHEIEQTDETDQNEQCAAESVLELGRGYTSN